MDGDKPPNPPAYTSLDTSNEQLKKIPFLTLGPPAVLPIQKGPESKSVSFRIVDISGNYISSR